MSEVERLWMMLNDLKRRVRLLEREFGFVPYESSRRGREFYRRLNGFFARSLASPTADGTKTRTLWAPRRSAANAHGDR